MYLILKMGGVLLALLWSTSPALSNDFKILMQKEGKVIPSKSIKSKDGLFAAKAPSLKPIAIAYDDTQKVYTFSLDIGGVNPIICSFSKEHIIAANWIHKIIAKLEEGLNKVYYERPHIGLTSSYPYIRIGAVYLDKEGDSVIPGYLKIIGADFGEHALLCYHDEPGYIKTFKETIKALLKNLKIFHEDQSFSRIQKEVLIVKNNDKKIGYKLVVLDYYKDSQVNVELESIFYRQNKTTLVQRAFAKITASSYKGKIFSLTTALTQDGANIFDLKVDRQKDKYLITGHHEGKKVKKTINTKAPLLDYSRRKNLIKSKLLRKSEGGSIEFTDYHAQSSHLRFQTTVLSQRKNKGEWQYQRGEALSLVKFDRNANILYEKSLKAKEPLEYTRIFFRRFE